MFPKRLLPLTLLAALALFADSASVAQIVWDSAIGPFTPHATSLICVTDKGTVLTASTLDFSVNFISRSSDHGKTWAVTGDTVNEVSSFAVNRVTHVIFAGVWGRTFTKSTDDGQTWVKCLARGLPMLGSLGPVMRSLAILSDGTLFAAVAEGVYRSTDNGDTWTPTADTTTQYLNIWATPNGTLFAAPYNGLMRSTDKGDTWSSVIKNGLSQIREDSEINAFAVSSGGILLAGTSGDGVFRSTDNGDSWSPFAQHILETDGSYIQSIAVDSEGNAIIGTDSGMFRTPLVGGTTSEITNGFTGLPMLGVATGTDGSLFASAGSLEQNAAMYLSTNDGDRWERTDSGLANTNVNCIAIDGNGGLMAGTYGDGIYRSTTEGNSWYSLHVTKEAMSVNALFVSQNGAMLAGTSVGVYRSTDTGNSWQLQNNNAFASMNTILSSTDGSLYAGTNNGVFRSSDDGQNWTPFEHKASNIVAMATNNKGLFFVAGLDAGLSAYTLSRSTDNGATWTTLPLFFDLPIASLAITRNGTLFLGEANTVSTNFPPAGLYQSMDSGKTWTLVPTDPAEAVNCLVVDSENRIFGESIYGLNYSTDDGKTWNTIGQGLPDNAIMSISFGRGKSIFIGGWGVWRINSEALGVKQGPGVMQPTIEVTNQPNPFTQSTSISFTLPEPSYTTLTLYDATGREVATLASGFMDAGEHDLPFQRGNLPSGVYFYRLESGSSSQTRAMVILP